jgi:hypothetical protein
MPKNRKQPSEDQDTAGSSNMPGGPETPGSLDLSDSRNDLERLKEDTSFIILPEVSDIPGQEYVSSIGPLGEMGDTTAASDDEEGIKAGKDITEEDDDIEIVMGTEADVTDEDLILLGAKDQDLDDGDDELISTEGLDDTDFDGDPLNEAASDIFSTGDDLDIPGTEPTNTVADASGLGDEENDYYSLGSDDNDNMTDGTP